MSLQVDATILGRLWNGVAIAGEDDCWLRKGHGSSKTMQWTPLNSGLSTDVKVAVYQVIFGNLPGKPRVRQTCGELRCCNPKHLVLIGPEDRVWSKVDKSGGELVCWPWTGAVANGMPSFNPGKTELSKIASAAVYQLTIGEIPKGKRVLHTCQNSLCCNPLHLTLSLKTDERFWSKVDKTPGLGPLGNCWEWIGHLSTVGYGQFSDELGRTVHAHRFALQLATSVEQSKDMFACHKCDNQKCCRPDHLFWGTATDNQRDMTFKGRHRWGENNGQAKLTEEQVMEIKKLLHDGQLSQREIGKIFGVGQGAISGIKLGKTWNPNELTPRRLRNH